MKKFRLGKSVIAILFGSVLISGSLVGCANTCDIEESSELVEATLTFEPEQHILYKHIERTNEGDRLVYHDGYSIVGISASQGGNTRILYSNNVEVICTPRRVGKEYYYEDFGTPVEQNTNTENSKIEDGSDIVFGVGQHILYKYIEQMDYSDRLVYHDGYSIVGVCASKGGPTKVLYVNNVEVTCSPRLVGTDYYYDNFGTPAEYTFDDEKTYILS